MVPAPYSGLLLPTVSASAELWWIFEEIRTLEATPLTLTCGEQTIKNGLTTRVPFNTKRPALTSRHKDHVIHCLSNPQKKTVTLLKDDLPFFIFEDATPFVKEVA